jgi:hypothetical protein
MKVMSDIDWSLAPEGADKLIQDTYEIYWGNEGGEWFDTEDMTWNLPLSPNHVTIATRPAEPPTQKTVADAWEYYKSSGETPTGPGEFSGEELLLWNMHDNSFWRGCEGFRGDIFELVCTREQFEAYGREQEAKQEGEKWTHVYNDHEVCRVLIEDPDRFGIIVIDTAGNGYLTCSPDEMKPIKPTITKAEAWDKLNRIDGSAEFETVMNSVMAIIEQYDITD